MTSRSPAPLIDSSLLLLFVFSGMLKWLPGLPIDATVLFGAGVVLCCTRALGLGSVRVGQTVILILGTALAFSAWYLLTATFTVSTSFWAFKAGALTLNFLALVAPIVCFRTERHFIWFDRCLWVLAGSCIAVVFAFYATGNIDFLIYQGFDKETFKIPDYLVLGSAIGLGVLSLLAVPRLWRVALAVCGILAMLVLAARGPILFVALLILLGGLIQRGRRGATLPGPLLAPVLLAVLGVAAMNWQGAELAFGRFAAILGDDTAYEGALRVGEFSIALDVIAQAPLIGVGLGGYGMSGYQMEENFYPHNLFLEAFAEAGVVGLILFAAGIAAVVVGGWRARRVPGVAGYLILVLFLLLNYLKSGGFVGARDLYLFMGVLAARIDISRNGLLALFGVPAHRSA